jgi:hypothetical protein
MPHTPRKTQRESLYSVHPAFAYQESIIANLKEKTGKTLEEWMRVLKQSRPGTRKERAAWLKRQHQLGTGTAMLIAERAEGKGSAEDYDPEAMVEAMFAGPRQALRPIYAELLRLGLQLGKDVKACPCKTIVPLYRQHVFAEIKPATQTRLDLGLALAKTKPAGRLVSTGRLAKGDRITHRIPITTLAEIDPEVKRWLQAAYDLDA